MGTTVANLGMTDVAFPAPVFAGDTISTRTTVVSARASKSRQDAGIVTFRHIATNQRGEVVARCDRAALMLKRPNAT
jgi:acyl dehydratase